MKRTLKWLGKVFLRLSITFLIVMAISFIPRLYYFDYNLGEISINLSFSNYVHSLTKYISNLLHGSMGSYEITRFGQDNLVLPITGDIFRYYKQSVFIFLSGLFSGVFFGLLAAFYSLKLRQKWRNVFQIITFMIVALPDFFIIILLQISVILIYMKTGIRLFNIATAGGNTAYFLPIFTLSIFPFVYVYRTAIQSFEDILSERYIQTAYAKGLTRTKVLANHVLKNGIISILNNLPNIVMLTLSNLIILEYMYNSYGITTFAFNKANSTNVLASTVFLLWIMIELILLTNDIILYRISKNRGELNA